MNNPFNTLAVDWLNLTTNALLAAFVFVGLILILIVLIQRGRGGGLASAFGGGSGNTAFGSKTGDVLTWFTAVIFGIFLVLAVALNLLANKQTSQSNATSPRITPVAAAIPPAAAATPATPPADSLPALPVQPMPTLPMPVMPSTAPSTQP